MERKSPTVFPGNHKHCVCLIHSFVFSPLKKNQVNKTSLPWTCLYSHFIGGETDLLQTLMNIKQCRHWTWGSFSVEEEMWSRDIKWLVPRSYHKVMAKPAGRVFGDRVQVEAVLDRTQPWRLSKTRFLHFPQDTEIALPMVGLDMGPLIWDPVSQTAAVGSGE